MTALEDFLAEIPEGYRLVEVPGYFGLAIVATAGRLADTPALVAALDRLESADGRLEQLRVVEQVRVRAMAQHHTVVRQRDARIAELEGPTPHVP
jgi:hypothetical protein